MVRRSAARSTPTFASGTLGYGAIFRGNGTKSAGDWLNARRRKEARFASDLNHRISKAIVRKATGTGRGIAVEDLTHIRERTTVQRSQRRAHHSWAFAQLRAFLSYKAGTGWCSVDRGRSEIHVADLSGLRCGQGRGREGSPGGERLPTTDVAGSAISGERRMRQCFVRPTSEFSAFVCKCAATRGPRRPWG
jgi:IS605 OrfB family transposase